MGIGDLGSTGERRRGDDECEKGPAGARTSDIVPTKPPGPSSNHGESMACRGGKSKDGENTTTERGRDLHEDNLAALT